MQVVDADGVDARSRAAIRNTPSAPRIMPVRAEAAVARQRAARDVLHRVGAERDHEADEQHLLAVEQPVGERREREPRIESATTIRAGEDRARERRLAHDRAAADARGAAVGDRPADLLLQREEEPGRDDEDEDPEPVEGRVLGLRRAP